MAYYIWGVLYLLVGTILFLVGAIEWKPWENPLKSNKKKKSHHICRSYRFEWIINDKGME